MGNKDDDTYRPPLANFWDHLEAQHGPGFRFEVLPPEDLAGLIAHLRDAVERDPAVTRVEKTNLAMVLEHAERVQRLNRQA